MLILQRQLALYCSRSPCLCPSFVRSIINNVCRSNSSSIASTIDAETKKDFFPSSIGSNSISEKKVSVLDELPALEDLSYVGPPIDYKSFNFAAYANENVVIQKLIDLGVDFYQIEKKKNLPSYLLQLNFDKHINPYISFLLDRGICIEELGKIFTKNPFFFRNNLNDLQVRINYLASKNFTDVMINDMFIKNPLLLNCPTTFIDNKLGFFQKEFKLKGFEVRHLASTYPRIITLPQKQLTPIVFDIKEVFGFSEEQSKEIILKQPYVLRVGRRALNSRFNYMVVDMELPLSLITADPSGLVNRKSRLQDRHLFLKSLNKAQYDPTKPNYVSISSITHGDDATFCEFIAKTSVETFNLFLKSL